LEKGHVTRDVNVFIFFLKTTTKIENWTFFLKIRFLKISVFNTIIFSKRSFFKTIHSNKLVVSSTIVNDDPLLTTVFIKFDVLFNDNPSLTIVNIIVNNVFSNTIVFSKVIVFLNNRYWFSKSSKRVGRF